MKVFKTADNDFEGFTSSIGVSKSNRNFIITILNGRPIKMFSVQNAIIDAYKTYLMDKRFPICVINVKVDPTLVDVNVHPSKNEVRLSKEKRTTRSLFSMQLKKVLMTTNIAPQIYSTPHSNEEQIKLDVVSFFNEKARFSEVESKNQDNFSQFMINEDINKTEYDFSDNSQNKQVEKNIH